MNEYLENWLKVIDGMRSVNTYKLAWGRSLIELCYLCDSDEREVIFTFDQISENFLKYFWNQTYFFKFYQGPARTKPVIQQITEEAIEWYQKSENSTLPVWFDVGKEVLKKEPENYNRMIKRVSVAMAHDVAWRFDLLGRERIELYSLDLANKEVKFTQIQLKDVKDHAFVLSQLLNYRWAQLLEKFNQAPRITSKVKGFSDEKLQRSSLAKFKKALLQQFPDGIVKDFYTDEILNPKDISIDHVIPWSFMYSDDIWNLVITSKEANARKSNTKTTEDYINKLKQRNRELVSVLDEKFVEALLEAEEHGFVDRYYFQFKL